MDAPVYGLDYLDAAFLTRGDWITDRQAGAIEITRIDRKAGRLLIHGKIHGSDRRPVCTVRPMRGLVNLTGPAFR